MVNMSIIVPVYNVEKYLKDCLESLVNQTLENIEIILIDDGSTDGSLDIIKQYYKEYPKKIIYRSIDNGGAANARNAALELATGEYIGFVDSDDYIDLTMFEKMYRLGVIEQADIVTCGYNRIDMGNLQKRDVVDRRCFGYDVYKEPALFANNVPYIWNKIFKRTLIESQHIRFEPLRIFEDLLFTYKLFLKANKVVKVPETLYNYIYQREGSLTSVFSEKRFDIFLAFDKLITHCKEERVFYHFEEELMFLLLGHIFVVFDNPVKRDQMALKLKFINQCFAYLDREFPYWKASGLYFKKRKKNKVLFTKKTYWYAKTLFPVSFRRTLREAKRTLKQWKSNRAGRQYLKALNNSPVVPDRILIGSQQGKNLNGNMFYILKQLCSEEKYEKCDIGIVYAENSYDKFVELMDNYSLRKSNVKLVKLHSKEFAKYLATAKYLFNDTSFATYYIKREEQVYLNTWHGTPLKTLGRSTTEDYYDIANVQKNFLVADYLLYPSEYMFEYMFRDYMLSPIFRNKVILAGYPRNEIFFVKERYEAIRQENDMMGKTCIAYMPTWRGNVRKVSVKQQKRDVVGYLRKLDARLTEEQILFVNLHPFLANNLSYDKFEHIRPFPRNYETYDFLNACDMLITDYSSVMFDYAITKRKVVLFAYDEEEYFANRGVYISLDELPFPKVDTVDGLIEEINNGKQVDYTEFLQKFGNYESHDITKRICDTVICGEDAGLKCLDFSDNKNKVAMVHVHSFACNIMPVLKKICAATDFSGDTTFYYTYDTKDLNGKQQSMKQLPEEFLYFGKLNSFGTLTLGENLKLDYIAKSSRKSAEYDAKLQQLYLREKERAFGHVDFSTEIIIGRERARTLGYVAAQPCKKVMYLSKEDDINLKVSIDVYNKFDLITVKDEALKEYLREIGICTEIKVMELKDLNSI